MRSRFVSALIIAALSCCPAGAGRAKTSASDAESWAFPTQPQLDAAAAPARDRMGMLADTGRVLTDAICQTGLLNFSSPGGAGVFPALLKAGETLAHRSGLPLLANLEIESGIEDKSFYAAVTAVQPVWQDESDRHHVFLQAGWLRTNSDLYADSLNIGLAYRYLTADQKLLLGTSLFFDHAYANDNNRIGIGFDARTKFLGLALNRYLPVSGWRSTGETTQERAAGGWDLQLRGQVAALPSWTATVAGYTWDKQGDEKKIYGTTAGIEYAPVRLISFRIGVRDENRQSPSAEAGIRINWQFHAPATAQVEPLAGVLPVAAHVYDKVQRENRVRVSRRTLNAADRTAPGGYSVAFTSGPVTPLNTAAVSFTLSGGEVGSTFTYVIASSGGGTVVTGSGTVTADPQIVSGIDVTNMQDGTLTLNFIETDASNNAGAAATDTVGKDARYVCGSVFENGNLTLTAPAGEVFTSVAFASYGTPNGACHAYTLGGCHAAASAAIVGATFLGQNSGTQAASNGIFGDPCGGTFKRMYVELRY